VWLIRRAIPIAIAAAFGCGLITEIDDIQIGEAPIPDAVSGDGGATDSGEAIDGEMPDTRPPPEPVIVDAEAYEAGDAGYTNVVGHWAGHWRQDFTVVGGEATLDLTQEGSAVSGNAEVKGPPCPRVGSLDLKFTAADKMAGTFRSTDGNLVLNLNWTLSADGNTMKGRFQSVGSCMPGAFGTAEVSHAPR
jgi:hypothetical protein